MKLILLLLALTSVAFADTPTFDVNSFLTVYPNIKKIQTGLSQHKFSCQALIKGYLDRIRLYNLSTSNDNTPLNAITQINPQAVADAINLDTNGDKFSSKPLFCIPVIVKDNIDVSGLRTSSGSLGLIGTYPLNDAEIVKNIKKQGGIIIAKSSMDELASGMVGVSSLSGRIGNAFNPNFNSGGSSGGSAVSIAAGFSPLAIGTDNSGSVRIPAAYNGIYALRPTHGLINSLGIFPLGNIDATAGPMANNVIDLANLLSIMTNNNINYTQNLNNHSLKEKHFAIIKSVAGKSIWDGMPLSITTIYKNIETNLKKEGVIISEITLPKYNLIRNNNMAGTIEDVNAYFINNHTISAIDNFAAICTSETRAYGKPLDCAKFIKSVKSKQSTEYQQAINTITKNQEYITNVMQENHLDGLILPSGSVGTASNTKTIGTQSVIASNSGLPEITFPVAQYNGLPVGLEIISTKNSESQLLNYAFSYQEKYYSFKAPELNTDTQFKNWNIAKLNLLYMLIGKISYESIIKPNNKNDIATSQARGITQKAITMLNNGMYILK